MSSRLNNFDAPIPTKSLFKYAMIIKALFFLRDSTVYKLHFSNPYNPN